MIDVSASGLYIGDCRDLLKQLPDGCVQTCVTSPPYWGLRDYGHEGQLGLEATPDLFVANMVDVFREVHRVLRDDGTLWMNLGDCYVTNPRGPGGAGSSTLTGTPDSERRRQRWAAAGNAGDPRFDNDRQQIVRAVAHPANKTIDPRVKGRQHATATSRGLQVDGLKHKDLVGIPWMTAFALRAAGWWLRMDVIWSKTNPMPESVTDRPSRAHECIFLLSKSANYFYDVDAVRTPQKTRGERHEGKSGYRADHPSKKTRTAHTRKLHPLGANRRSVWTVSTKPYSGAHFATFPPDLIQPCILAGSREGDLVLDPFFGSGTTGAVAEMHGRRWIGFDLGYEELAKQRTAQRSLPMGGGNQ